MFQILLFRCLFTEDDNLRRPMSSQFVAAVYVGDNPRYNYDVTFFPRSPTANGPRNLIIHEASPTLDVMLYPLIHLHAEDPWLQVVQGSRRNTRHRSENWPTEKVGTIRQYYSSRLMKRHDGISQDRLFRCGPLLQQWLCDAAMKIEDLFLRYAEEHQDELQVCQMDSLKKFVAETAENMGKQPGRIVLLPKGAHKSEKSMFNKYMDSISISLAHGSPTFFLTFTTNPNWPEIRRELENRCLNASDYALAPDVVVRAFLTRLNIFMSDIINKGILGRVRAYVGVHEFTSTFLPHFHLAIILHSADAPSSADDVDGLLCAEIPPEEADPQLYELVMKVMIHRPCDGSIPNYRPKCRKNSETCSHGFPFVERECTVQSRGGYVLRRRKMTPIFHAKFGCYIDNTWVVPYNPKLLKYHQNHLNIMICAENLFFKYLFGYMQKESSGQRIQGSMYKFATAGDGPIIDWNEIEHHRSLRVLGPYEAVYMIFGIPMTRMSHSVVSLPIHLPGKELVYYRGDVRSVPIREDNSKFLAWFRLNASSETARLLLYADIVKYYK